MMPNLVDQYVADEVVEIVAVVRPFIEDRASEQADSVGQRPRMLDAALGQRNAFVEARQLERVLDAHRRQRFLVGELLDLEHDVAEVARERLGQLLERVAGDRLDIGGGRRGVEAAHGQSHRVRRAKAASLPRCAPAPK